MTKIVVKNIPQDSEWHMSFNVLVSLDIQGKEGFLIKKGKPPTWTRGSMSAEIKVGDKYYGVPDWAYMILPIEPELKNEWVII